MSNPLRKLWWSVLLFLIIGALSSTVFAQSDYHYNEGWRQNHSRDYNRDSRKNNWRKDNWKYDKHDRDRDRYRNRDRNDGWRHNFFGKNKRYDDYRGHNFDNHRYDDHRYDRDRKHDHYSYFDKHDHHNDHYKDHKKHWW